MGRIVAPSQAPPGGTSRAVVATHKPPARGS